MKCIAIGSTVVRADSIISVGKDWKKFYSDGMPKCKYYILCNDKGGHKYSKSYENAQERDEDFDRIMDKLRRGGKMNCFKEYFEKHQDQIITVAFVILLDHLVFGGMFRDRLKRMIEGVLGSAEKALVEDTKDGR